MDRIIDLIFLLYFGSHIPIAIFIDSQALFPRWMYHTKLVDLVDWFTREFRDPVMSGKPAWFQSFILCEVTVQLPFFFVSFYTYWKGISRYRWMRIPMIVYTSHVITSLICILYHFAFHDFSQEDSPGPRNTKERLVLSCFYLPYFIVPVLLLYDALFHPIYLDKTFSKDTKQSRRHQNKKKA